jgi:hypothetical protein
MEYDAADRIHSRFLKMERTVSPETSVTNYQPTPRNKLQQRRPKFKGVGQRINRERDQPSGSVAHTTANISTRWPSDKFIRSSLLHGRWQLSESNHKGIIIIIIIIIPGSAAKRGLWPPRPRGFMITHYDAPQSVGLPLDE